MSTLFMQQCDICEKFFSKKCNLLRHKRIFHGVERKGHKKCSACHLSFPSMKSLRAHIYEDHDVDVEVEEISFKDRNGKTLKEPRENEMDSGFQAWKYWFELTTSSKYVKSTADKNYSMGTIQYLQCHRSKRSDGKGKKIDSTCPSSMKVIFTPECIKVILYKTHFGHDVDAEPVSFDKELGYGTAVCNIKEEYPDENQTTTDVKDVLVNCYEPASEDVTVECVESLKIIKDEPIDVMDNSPSSYDGCETKSALEDNRENRIEHIEIIKEEPVENDEFVSGYERFGTETVWEDNMEERIEHVEIIKDEPLDEDGTAGMDVSRSSFCNEGSGIESALEDHLSTQSQEPGTSQQDESSQRDRPFPCPQCSKTFLSKCQLFKHSSVHNDDRPFQCTTCGKGFKYNSNLKDHMKTHNPDKPFSCEGCGRVYSSKKACNQHVKRYKIGEGVYTCKSSTFQEVAKRLFNCEICHKTVKCPDYLKTHMKIHSEEIPFKCDVCGKGFKFKTKLRVHYRIHSDKDHLKCDICGSSFKDATYFKEHKLSHNEDYTYKFKCEICGKGFTYQCQLRLHSATHSDEKPYKCDICGSSYKQISYLREHRLCHSEDKPFKCGSCARHFSSRKKLRRHSNFNCKGKIVEKKPEIVFVDQSNFSPNQF